MTVPALVVAVVVVAGTAWTILRVPGWVFRSVSLDRDVPAWWEAGFGFVAVTAAAVVWQILAGNP